MWYLEAAIFVCSISLWSFVFAWHEAYSKRLVITFKVEPKLILLTTLIGIATALAAHQWLDPSLRSAMPEDYPVDLKQWLAALLFSLTFNQLFLVFAPFAWFLRVLKNQWVAASLTALFGAGILAMKAHSLAIPIPPSLLTLLVAGKVVTGLLAVWLYLRGGILLLWWWAVLFESRYWLGLAGQP